MARSILVALVLVACGGSPTAGAVAFDVADAPSAGGALTNGSGGAPTAAGGATSAGGSAAAAGGRASSAGGTTAAAGGSLTVAAGGALVAAGGATMVVEDAGLPEAAADSGPANDDGGATVVWPEEPVTGCGAAVASELAVSFAHPGCNIVSRRVCVDEHSTPVTMAQIIAYAPGGATSAAWSCEVWTSATGGGVECSKATAAAKAWCAALP